MPSAVEEVQNRNCWTKFENSLTSYRCFSVVIIVRLFWYNWPVKGSEAGLNHRGLLIAERVGLTIIAILSVRTLTHSTRTGLLN